MYTFKVINLVQKNIDILKNIKKKNNLKKK